MSKHKYTHIQALLPEIKSMLAFGMTQREVGIGIIQLPEDRAAKLLGILECQIGSIAKIHNLRGVLERWSPLTEDQQATVFSLIDKV